MTGDGHRGGNRRNDLVAVRHLEGHLTEVGVRVGELFLRKTHIRLAVGVRAFHHIRSGGGSRTAEGEVNIVARHLIQVGAGRGGVARYGMFLTVVGGGVVRTHDGHRGVNRGDGLVAVRHLEGHLIEVLVRVGELFLRETHIRLTVGIRAFHHIRSGCRGRAAEDEVNIVARHLVQVGAGRGGVTRHGMFLTVVRGGVVRTHDRDRGIDLVDGLVTVRDIEDDIREVGVRVGELVLRTGGRTLQTHVRGTGNGSGSRSRTAEGKVVHRIERIADGDIIAGHTMFLTIIGGGVVMAGDGHHHLIEGGDGLVAVRHLEVHLVEVRGIRVGELTGSKTHVRSADIGTLRCNHTIHQSGVGSRGEREIGGGVERIAVGHIVTRHRMLVAIKGSRIVMAGDGHRHIDLVDGLVTVGHVEGHRAEVRIRVGELVLSAGIGTLQAHIGGTGISAFGSDNTIHIDCI